MTADKGAGWAAGYVDTARLVRNRCAVSTACGLGGGDYTASSNITSSSKARGKVFFKYGMLKISILWLSGYLLFIGDIPGSDDHKGSFFKSTSAYSTSDYIVSGFH